jgi:hypothetical protein
MISKLYVKDAYNLIDNEIIEIEARYPKANDPASIMAKSIAYQLKRARALLEDTIKLIDKFNDDKNES